MKPVVVLEELLRLLEEVKQGMPELEFRQYKRKVALLLLEAGRRLLGPRRFLFTPKSRIVHAPILFPLPCHFQTGL